MYFVVRFACLLSVGEGRGGKRGGDGARVTVGAKVSRHRPPQVMFTLVDSTPKIRPKITVLSADVSARLSCSEKKKIADVIWRFFKLSSTVSVTSNRYSKASHRIDFAA